MSHQSPRHCPPRDAAPLGHWHHAPASPLRLTSSWHSQSPKNNQKKNLQTPKDVEEIELIPIHSKISCSLSFILQGVMVYYQPNALLEGKYLKITSNICSKFDPPKMAGISWPLFYAGLRSFLCISSRGTEIMKDAVVQLTPTTTMEGRAFGVGK